MAVNNESTLVKKDTLLSIDRHLLCAIDERFNAYMLKKKRFNAYAYILQFFSANKLNGGVHAHRICDDDALVIEKIIIVKE